MYRRLIDTFILPAEPLYFSISALLLQSLTFLLDMKPNFYLIFKQPRYFSCFSHCTQRRRIHTGPPVLPCGLCIDRDKPLANTAPTYNQHVVISTGRDDWASRIESEDGPNMAKDLKELLGLKGEFHHVRHHQLKGSAASAYLRNHC